MYYESLEIQYRYNLRSHRAELNQSEKGWQPTTDLVISDLVTHIAKRFSYNTSKQSTSPLKYGRDNWQLNFNALLNRNKVDPFILWLESLPKWDGVKRIDTYLLEHFDVQHSDDDKGKKDKKLSEWVSRFLVLGPIERAYEPGSKIDQMPVLLGSQGIGKSALLRSLLPEDANAWFCDSLNLTADSKSRAESLQGRVIAEVSEMTGATRADLESR